MPDSAIPLPNRPVDVVIVGAGFAGMYALHRFREIGLNAIAVESGEEVGGVWFWNRYPGARCDIPSLEYSYSFSRELYADWNWTERYATQPEILDYARHVADRFDLRRSIHFHTTVTAARYDESADRWTVQTSSGTINSRYLILAVGQVSAPNIPDINGLDTFGGDIYHTSSWPEVDVDLTDRRVALIGTGSTGIQVLPKIAPAAAATTVFQRTPTFAVPMVNYPYGPDGEDIDVHKKAVIEDLEKARTSRFGNNRVVGEESALDVDSQVRQAKFEAAWDSGNTASILLAYRDILTDLKANGVAADFLRDKIREMVTDPAKAERLIPRGYPVGAKRPSLEQGYYEAFNRDDVKLVDVREEPILEVEPAGIRTSERLYELDTIIFATGFDTLTGAILKIDIRGRGDLALREKWAAGPQTYMGLGVHGFPNLLIVAGPGSPSLLSNVIGSIEHHVDWVADLMLHVRDRGASTVEATADAERAWREHSDEVASGTLYPLADTAYTGANVPGKPRVLLPYVGGVGAYRDCCSKVAANDYDGFEIR
ncbi:NAD(P)/FAD-dependent oxidoreductase [Arthrobacter sp. W4I7]|uniref:flavin-containing monooxygenase n=1 Tax=Arthrobacter sp. W4I7 TaxID=3042296 RepID=UPI0027877A1A|nr:NAD(P)/FAD-dependent oxidoreductase [Arthrobacter sp. W4I7]MDQ0691399.1 cation diffusion facilitator CzcD-associated flavoprotein CzcO [Arthrobacter sp. W4I7]